MQKGYSPSDYLYASARIRALEARLATKEQLGALAEGGAPADVIATLFEAAGVAPTAERNGKDAEAALLAVLKGAIATVAASVPDQSIVHLIQFPYDCHNAKAYLKCHYRGIDAAPLLIDAGSVPANDLQAALKKNDRTLLPSHMSEAFSEAEEAYAKTGDPREIDFLLDRALFEDLADAANAFPFAKEIFEAKADLANILICLRLVRSNPLTAEALFGKAALPGGTLEKDLFAPAFTQGEHAFLKALAATPYQTVVKNAKASTPAELEKRADDYITKRLSTAKNLPFGAEIPLAYLLALEGIIKNIRILLSGRAAGLDGATLLSRVRESYV